MVSPARGTKTPPRLDVGGGDHRRVCTLNGRGYLSAPERECAAAKGRQPASEAPVQVRRCKTAITFFPPSAVAAQTPRGHGASLHQFTPHGKRAAAVVPSASEEPRPATQGPSAALGATEAAVVPSVSEEPRPTAQGSSAAPWGASGAPVGHDKAMGTGKDGVALTVHKHVVPRLVEDDEFLVRRSEAFQHQAG